jgi:hypothetical protein
MPIIDPSKQTRDAVPRPTRQQLSQAADQVWRFANEQAHNLERAHDPEKNNFADPFFAACIKVAASNLMAIRQLSSPYLPECGCITRNLVEACVDFFWVASFLDSDLAKGERLAHNFFLYAQSKFVESAPFYASLAKADHFFRDIKTPFEDFAALQKCRDAVGVRRFGNDWRFDREIFSSNRETKWDNRAKVAASYAEKAVNLRGAPFLTNLRVLSSYAHFDPAQISQASDEFRERHFDRNFNLAIGFVYDMLVFTFKWKHWEPPQPLGLLQNSFLWFST